MKKITRIGIGGPVGSGKTAIIEVITPILINRGYKPLIITNDIVTTEDAKQVKRTLKGILAELESMLGSCQELADSALAKARIHGDPDLSANVERINVKVYEAPGHDCGVKFFELELVRVRGNVFQGCADADAFLATQGDQWDTQWDMFLCLLGAAASLLLLSRWHDRQLGPGILAGK